MVRAKQWSEKNVRKLMRSHSDMSRIEKVPRGIDRLNECEEKLEMLSKMVRGLTTQVANLAERVISLEIRFDSHVVFEKKKGKKKI